MEVKKSKNLLIKCLFLQPYFEEGGGMEKFIRIHLSSIKLGRLRTLKFSPKPEKKVTIANLNYYVMCNQLQKIPSILLHFITKTLHRFKISLWYKYFKFLGNDQRGHLPGLKKLLFTTYIFSVFENKFRKYFCNYLFLQNTT